MQKETAPVANTTFILSGPKEASGAHLLIVNVSASVGSNVKNDEKVDILLLNVPFPAKLLTSNRLGFV